MPVSITGGKYSINGGAFTTAAGTVSAMQTIVVKVMSSNTNSTAIAATLTVGGVSSTYTVTTLADAIPDAFTFVSKVEAELGITYPSNAITVSGIEVATAISITGGEYSINGGAFTSVAGTVTNGQTVTVKAVAPATTETTQEVLVTIGGVSGTYSVTTPLDEAAPIAEFKFPTPYTMSEANRVKVRGTATDDHAITSVKVVVTNNLNATVEEKEVTPAAEGDYSSWTVEVPLTALAENEIKVVAMDDRGNEIAEVDANKVVIRQADVASAFPDGGNEFYSIFSSAIDANGGHKRILVADDGKIWAVDLKTGQRSLFTNHENICSGPLYSLLNDEIGKKVYGYCLGGSSGLVELNIDDGSSVAKYTSEFITKDVFGMTLDRSNGRARLVLAEQSWWWENPGVGGNLVLFSIDAKNYSILYRADQEPIIQDAQAIIVDGDRYLIAVGGQNENVLKHQIVSVDALTGLHTVVADNTIGSGEPFNALLPDGNIDVLRGMALDKKRNVLFVNEMVSDRLLTVDLSTNTRAIFKNIIYKNTDEPDTLVEDIDINVPEDYLVLTDNGRKSILLIDILTGEKVILSKAANEY